MKTPVIFGIIILITQIKFSQTGSNLRISFDPFRYLTNQFLSTIQPNATAVLYFNDTFLANKTFSDISAIILPGLKTYVGYVILLIIALLFLFIFTIFGCCFCCCRLCCKKCGAKVNNKATKSTKNKRIVFNVLVLIFSSMILIGAIVAMASNFILIETIRVKNVTDTEGNIFFLMENLFNKSVNYAQTLIQNVMVNGKQIIYNILNEGLVSLRDVTNTFMTRFSNVLSTEELLTSLKSLISNYKSMATPSAILNSTASQHNTTTQNFTQYLQDVVNKLNATLSNDTCSNVTECQPVKDNLKNLVLGFNTSKITYDGDINAVNVLHAFDITNLENATSEVNQALSKIQNEINSTISDYMNTFISSFNGSDFMSGLEKTINGSVINLNSVLNGSIEYLLNTKITYNKTIKDDVLYDYAQYWLIGFCVLVSIILLIVLLYYLGLCYGICGSPGDYSRCNKGCGSRFFIGSVALSFIFGWLIMLIATIMFLPGGFMYTECCTYMNTKDLNRIQLVDKFINPYQSNWKSIIPGLALPDINVYESLLLRCPTSPDLLTAFNISNAYMDNITSFIYNKYISKYVNDSISKMENISISAVNTTNLDKNLNTLKTVIDKLNNSISQDAVAELQKSVILLDIEVFLNSINTLKNTLTSANKTEAVKSLTNAVLYLNSSVTSMSFIQTSYASQKINFNQLVTTLSSNFNNVTSSLNNLKTRPNDARNMAFQEAKTKLITLANNTVNSTLYNVIKAVGNCAAIYDLFMGIYNILCVVFLGPFNNMWMGIGWFLLFTIPAMIFAVKLASLYQISHIESDSAAYNHAYMSSNQFITKSDFEMIKMKRPQKA